GELFAVCYADLDHFKQYDDRYSYNDGDRVIYILSRILHDVVKGMLGNRGFVGHIGGDDFIFVIPFDPITDVCGEVLEVFDTLIPYQYNEQDRRAGYYFGKDRRGQLHRVPLMTLSIGIVTNQHRRFAHPAQVSELATEMKSYAKTQPGSAAAVSAPAAPAPAPPAMKPQAMPRFSGPAVTPAPPAPPPPPPAPSPPPPSRAPAAPRAPLPPSASPPPARARPAAPPPPPAPARPAPPPAPVRPPPAAPVMRPAPPASPPSPPSRAPAAPAAGPAVRPPVAPPAAPAGAPPSPPPVPRAPAAPAAVAGAAPGQRMTGPLRPVNPFMVQDPKQKARRLARALVSDLVVYHPEKRQQGLRDGTLPQLFKDEIEKSWREYVEQVGAELAKTTSFWAEALNEILAGGNKVF